MASKDPDFYRSRNANFQRVDPPEYVAFRKADGDSTLAVIARLEARDTVGNQLGRWFSASDDTESFPIVRSVPR